MDINTFSARCIRSRLTIVAVFVVCLLSMSGMAKAVVIGPIPDFKGFRTVATPITIDTFIGLQASIPFDGSISIGRPDSITFTVNIAVPIFAASYITITSTVADSFDLATDTLLATDIWALDLEPLLDPDLVPLMTGFNALTPEIEPLGPEVFFGISGTPYTAAFNQTVTIGNLASLPQLAGFDLSKFGGDPNSIVYVSQAEIPAIDFATAVPEPGTMPLFGLGLAVALIVRRRHGSRILRVVRSHS